MPLALICSERSPERELGGTALWRSNIERRIVGSAAAARAEAAARPPQIILVDRDLPDAAGLVNALRQGGQTRRVSVVVLARGDFEPREAELMGAGANAILRLPAGPEWDDRVHRLMNVPLRREIRLDVELRVRLALGAHATLPGVALNLSTAGMLVVCGGAMKVGDDVHFSLPLPPRAVRGHGTVIRLQYPDRYGLEIASVEGDGRQHIRHFVESAG